MRRSSLLRVVVLIAIATLAEAASAAVLSHPPMRALPTASNRAKAEGPAKFVDAGKGNDANDGSEARPWRTLAHAVPQLAAGDTLYLRGGTYYETVTVANKAAADAPITIRAYPGELAIIDAGHREFLDDPAVAWEKAPGGHADEFRSTKAYAIGGNFGNFADSMVPLHRYLDFYDLRSANEFYRKEGNNRQTDPVGIYCGPGVRRDPETGRIHVRLSHTRLPGLGDRAYRGETDPRKVPLVVAGHDHTLVVAGAAHVRFQDLIFRGAARSAVSVTRDHESIALKSEDVTFDGCTLYGSGSALRAEHVRRFRMTNCAVRGHTAPWLSRYTNKNRAYAGYLVMIEGDELEFDHSDFTDHHDFLQCEGADRLKFHHNVVDNFDDDGFEPGPKRSRGTALIYQNLVTRVLNPFTAHAEKPIQIEAEPGSGLYVFRNVFDFRRGTYKGPPTEADPSGEYLNHPTTIICHDHGSPTANVYYVYHNTFVMPADAYRGTAYLTWTRLLRGTTRRVFNNIFVTAEGVPGQSFASVAATEDFEADGNLFWGAYADPATATGYFAKFRSSPLFEASKKAYPPGWGAGDLFADPKFIAFEATAAHPADLRLQQDSAAIDAGHTLPKAWPDVLRDADAGKPDIGAFPVGAEPLHVGPALP
jgi:hypothetical protein